jgi:hypothetical protein
MYNKYLKYKNKYLSLKKMFGGMYQEPEPEPETISVIACLPNGEERSIRINKEPAEVVNEVARVFGVLIDDLDVSFNDNVIGLGYTAEDCGIVNGSRLTIRIDTQVRTTTKFRRIIVDICNHPDNLRLHLVPDDLVGRVESTPGTDDLLNINFSGYRLRALPDSFKNIIIVGNLILSDNELTSFPRDFNSNRIEGSLTLDWRKFDFRW